MSYTFSSLPASWNRVRLDRIATVNARIGWKALTADEYQSEGYAFLATPNIKGREIDFGEVNYISEFRYQESPELKLREGDVLLAKDGNTLGIVNIVRGLPREATVNGSIAVLRASAMDPRFIRYVIASNPIQSHIGSVKDGMGVPHLFQRDIKRFLLPEPPFEEQRRIADFLDFETDRLDALAAARASQLRCLEQLWDSLLATSVDHLISAYGLLPMRRFVESVEQGWSPQCDDVEADPSEWAVLKTSSVSSGEFMPLEHKRLPDGIDADLRYQIEDGDVLLTRGSGSPSHVGVCAVARTDGRKLLLSDLMYRVKLSREWSPDFVALALGSRPVRGFMNLLFRGQSGQTIKLRSEDVRSISLPAAPPVRQRETVEELMRVRSGIREAWEALRRSSALLVEHRQALITAAVTGQFDVSTASGRNVTSGTE
ncbi:restriction endonuclease subunit S [Streptomyces niveiscabiei]|uniref:restriction endonuclease subunit S n=1 Tax=Streptomyces niveiscabiei TaxID=164115 RepID=UPI0029B00AA4|nr:restriction endonuclease subunit S [Streptomyces niveiscabiei]MDX3384477.1 restriction endonuclease subunit S [Streptomyces niveiscabiei]